MLAAPLLLAGCTGFGAFLAHTFTLPGVNPNRPSVDSENVRRAYGQRDDISPLKPEPGNVWPGPTPPDPTLTDIEKQQDQGPQLQGQPNGQGQPQGQSQGQPPRQPRGSSTPPGSVPPQSSAQPGVPPSPSLPTLPPGLAPPAPGQFTPGGTVAVPGPGGGVRNDAGGTNAYRQLTTPGGAGAIVVPNGNGTSTVISPDGGVQVVPTPR